MRLFTVAALVGAVSLAGCTWTGPPPQVIASSIKVSAPVNGVSTVSQAGKVADRFADGVSIDLPRNVRGSSLEPNWHQSNTAIFLNWFQDFRPFTIGSSEDPILSGDVLVAKAWVRGFVSPVDGPTVSITVP